MAAIALALAAERLGARVERRLASGRGARAAVGAAAIVLVLGGAAAMALRAGKITKHDRFHRDLGPASAGGTPALGQRPLVTACPPELTFDWPLVGDLQRYLEASLTAEPGAPYWLTEVGFGCRAPAGCRQLRRGEFYALFRCAAPG